MEHLSDTDNAQYHDTKRKVKLTVPFQGTTIFTYGFAIYKCMTIKVCNDDTATFTLLFES